MLSKYFLSEIIVGLAMGYRKYILITFTLLAIVFMSACSHHSSLQTFNNHYYGGDSKKAYTYAKSQASKDGDVLWNLQAGMSGFVLAENDTSALLEQGERLFSKYEGEGLMGGMFGNVGAVLVNENVKTYRGNIYEGVMFNYYKALNAMRMGDYALARVEFNRANDRQRRAKEYFRKDIQKAMAESNKEQRENQQLKQIDKDRTSRSTDSILESQYSNLSHFVIYDGFINPAVSYVSALFFMSEGDYPKAIDLYKESYGITRSQVINQDLKVVNARQAGDNSTYTWFIIEDGRSASLEDVSIDLPAYIVSSRVLHAGVSIPQIKRGQASANTYKAITHSENLEFKAFEVGNLEGVLTNEFSQKLPFILTRAITSSIIKASTQAALSNLGGEQLGMTGALIGSLVGAMYSVATNSADIRISTALPHRILALQIPNKTLDFTLKADENTLYEVQFSCTKSEQKHKKIKKLITLCEKYDNIIYLRLKDKNPSYQILKGEVNEE